MPCVRGNLCQNIVLPLQPVAMTTSAVTTHRCDLRVLQCRSIRLGTMPSSVEVTRPRVYLDVPAPSASLTFSV